MFRVHGADGAAIESFTKSNYSVSSNLDIKKKTQYDSIKKNILEYSICSNIEQYNKYLTRVTKKEVKDFCWSSSGVKLRITKCKWNFFFKKN